MKETKNNKAFYAFIVLFIFAAIRYGVGYDYYSYLGLVNHDRADTAYERLEPLSNVLIYLGSITHYSVFFAIGSFLTLFPIYKICQKYSVNPVLSLLIYFLYPLFYLNFFSIVRNGIAISFVFYAFILLQERKWGKSMVFLICACLFHKSAALGVLIYPLYFIKHIKMLHWSAYIVSFIVSIIVAKIISDYASYLSLIGAANRYIEEKEGNGGQTMTIIVNLFGLINFLLWDRISKVGKHYSHYLAMCNVGICMWNVFLPLNSTIASRFCLTFLSPIILVIPTYAIVFKKRYRFVVKRFVYMFFISLFCAYFYINVQGFYKSHERMSNIPYQTIFWHEDYTNLQD